MIPQGLLQAAEREGLDLVTVTSRSGSKRRYAAHLLDAERRAVHSGYGPRMGVAVSELAARVGQGPPAEVG